MIKLILGVARRADWSREEWLTHYTERHGPLAAGLKVFSQHTLRYVQNYALTPEIFSTIPNFARQIDGISELWFHDVAVLAAAYADPNYMALVRPDELTFCDLNAITGGIGLEYQILTETLDDTDKKWVRKSRTRLIIFRQAAPAVEPSSASPKNFCIIVVRVMPGQITFTRMRDGASSSAADFVKPIMACFDAA
jgi:hypothetical protein